MKPVSAHDQYVNDVVCGDICCQKFAAAGDIFDAEMDSSDDDDDDDADADGDRRNQDHRDAVSENKG